MQAHAATEVWPENWGSFRLFCELQTQWLAGPNGVYGMNYAVLFSKLDRMGLTHEAYDEIEGDIRVMEYAALAVMSEKPE